MHYNRGTPHEQKERRRHPTKGRLSERLGPRMPRLGQFPESSETQTTLADRGLETEFPSMILRPRSIPTGTGIYSNWDGETRRVGGGVQLMDWT